MHRVLIGTAVILLAAGIGPSGSERRRETRSGRRASAPAYLKPVPMDESKARPRPVTIDIPVNGTIYPPDIIPPQFAWRDDNPAATVWRIEIIFGEKNRPIQVWSTARRCRSAPSTKR